MGGNPDGELGFSNPQADRMCRTSTIKFSGTTASNSDLLVMFMRSLEIHRVSNPQADRMSKLGMNSQNSDWYKSQQADRVFGGGRKRPERRRYSAWTSINLGEADDGEGEGAATVGNHLDEEGGSIAVSGEDVLVGVGWGGRRELLEGNDEGEDDKSCDEGLHLEAALRQGGGGSYSLVFPDRCSCFAF
ncbi:hypothetical protein MRB53_002676 [Persea americana]|uniref:Uncharacterized protein n=1 Tax=Persea americana TaxID=3435 RepID=A0ACC2MVW0_PERAE|nr:hypothetical protein MRB53_002676 [Persea americana]